ncbi:MAG: hypothetical protein ABFD64_10680 [Armatimonadota bacterium]
MKGEKACLESARSGRDIILANDFIRLKLIYRDGGYSQEFYGIDSTNQPRLILSTIHRNLIPFTEHRLPADPMFSGRRRHLFEVNRDSLRMVYSDAQITKTDDELSVTLSGDSSSGRFSSAITLTPGSKFVRVTMEFEPKASNRQPFFEYLTAAYAFLPDGLLLDNYSRPDYAWAPSLRPENDHIIGESSFKSPAVLVQRKKLLAAVIPDPNCPKALPVALDLDMMNGVISAPLLVYGFCSSKPDGQFSYHDRSMLLWPDEEKITCTFYIYIDAAARTDVGFEPVQERVWQMARSKEQSAVSTGLQDDLPSAYVRLVKSVELQKAHETIERVLADQTPAGLFAVQNTDQPYDAVRDSEACRWLLAVSRLTKENAGVLSACRTFGDFLVSRQLSSGAIPPWFSYDFEPLPELKESAETGATGRFLAELYNATGKRAYLKAACKSGKFVAKLIEKEHYIDRNVLFSGAADIRDCHTMILPQGSAAARYAADLMISLCYVTGDKKYLKPGLAAVSRMCWFQNTWSGVFGSFAAGNTIEESASGAAFGRTLLEYYSATHQSEYLERGLAAIYAGLSLGDADAAAIRTWAVNRFGAALIDVKNRCAHSIGLCSIHNLSFKPGTVEFNARNGFSKDHYLPATIKFTGLRGNSYKVTINGEGNRYSKVELESGISVKL